MSRIKKWDVKVSEKNYQVTFSRNFLGMPAITVNGKPVEIKISSYTAAFAGIVDTPIKLGKTTANLVAINKKADLAVDGYYLDSKKPYIPIGKMPKWTWFFIALCLIPPIALVGNIFPIIFSLLGVIFCIRFSIQPITAIKRIFACIGCTVVSYLLSMAYIFIRANFFA